MEAERSQESTEFISGHTGLADDARKRSAFEIATWVYGRIGFADRLCTMWSG